MKKEQDVTNNNNVKSIDLDCRKDMQESQPPLPAAPLPIAPYLDQLAQWPNDGQRVLAHYDETSVIVYQAYRPSIARYAVEHGRFGGPDFSFNRMSWIKPNFLWMMYRCGWATKEGQEMVLALRLRRAFFDSLLRQAVASSFAASPYLTPEEWSAAVNDSEVRLQWDPDHSPSGAKVTRRALQLGLRGSALKTFSSEALLEVIDMTAFVASQRPWARDDSAELMTPVERVYPCDATIARQQ